MKGGRLTPQVWGQGYPTRVSAQNWGTLNVPSGAHDGGRDPLREGRRRAADSREGTSRRRRWVSDVRERMRCRGE